MNRKLGSAPLAVAAVLGTAAPASASYCETAILLTGDRVRVCVDRGACVVEVVVAGVGSVPQAYACQPYPGGGPPYCDGVVGDVTADSCVLDPSCLAWVFVDPPSHYECVPYP